MEQLLLSSLNLILCAIWGWSSMIRLDMMHGHVLQRIAVLYICTFVASWVCGLQFFIFGTHAGYPDIITSAIIIGLLWTGKERWKHGPPSDVLLNQNHGELT